MDTRKFLDLLSAFVSGYNDEELDILLDRRNQSAIKAFLNRRVLRKMIVVGEKKYQVLRFGRPTEMISYNSAMQKVVEKNQVGRSTIDDFIAAISTNPSMSFDSDILKRHIFFFVVQNDEGLFVPMYFEYNFNHSRNPDQPRWLEHQIDNRSMKISAQRIIFIRKAR